MQIHIVKSGETLSSIARNYGVSVTLLQRLNEVPPSGALAVGQTLVVFEKARTRVVRPGETLTSIARSEDVPLLTLYQNNIFLRGRSDIEAGEELIVSLGEEQRGTLGVNGYAYPFIRPALLQQVLPYMTYLTPFTYGFFPSGQLVVPEDEEMLRLAPLYGAVPWMHLSTLTERDTFDNALGSNLLRNVEAQEALINSVERVIAEKGYRGLDVDFEYLDRDLGEEYAAFITRLTERLNPKGIPVLVALAPKTSATQQGLLYEAHDYRLLGQAANAVLLMTYEWGYTYGPPMAVSPMPQVRRVLDYALTEIPREKIFLGVPTYGYDWPIPYEQGRTKAVSVSPNEALRLARQYGAEIFYDERAQAPYFRYTTPNGIAHEVWFEDARASLAKFALAQESGLQGVGLWNLMRNAPQTYLVLHGAFDIEKLPT